MMIEPFRVDVPDSVLDDLRQRLTTTRWPDQVHGVGWEYGVDQQFLRSVVEYWANQFDWRTQERRINTFHHYRTVIDDIPIHFIHERGAGPNAVPLLLPHGWPGSFVEMLDIIPMLTQGKTQSFDVIVPSIPGFGYSGRPADRGMSTWRVAELFSTLMIRLGYSRYAAQGGDFAAGIISRIAWTRPQELIGIHLNYIPGSFEPDIGDVPPTAEEKRFLADRDAWWTAEGGYAHVHRTKPHTLAFALNDSPTGLAAWILEKFHGWSDCQGDLASRFSFDELLTNVMIYWTTETIGSSIRLYLETAKVPFRFEPGERIHVPCGIARFPLEAPFPPRSWIERVYDVTQWTDMPRGGHFAAMEEPRLLADDISRFFEQV